MIKCNKCFKEYLFKGKMVCRYCGNDLTRLSKVFTTHVLLLVFTLGIGNIIYLIISKIKLNSKLKKYVFPEDRKYIKGNKYKILDDLEIIYDKFGKDLLKYQFDLKQMESILDIVLSPDYKGKMLTDKFKEIYFRQVKRFPNIKVFYEEYYKALNIDYEFICLAPIKYYILLCKKEKDFLESVKVCQLALKLEIRYDYTNDTKMVLQRLIKAYNKEYEKRYKFDYKTLTLYDDNTGVVIE